MTDLDISVFEPPESDWEVWRDLRLAALRDAPGAFGETLTAALQRDEDNWRGAWRAEPPQPRFIAAIAGKPQGMCSIVLPADHDFQPLIIAMWISPVARGRGLGPALLDACVAWCRRNSFARLRLGVVEDNEAAARLYARYGFRYDGTGEPLLSDPSKLVMWMELPIKTNAPADAVDPVPSLKPIAVPSPTLATEATA
ncbi:GNAT family N-acetyltransferase [Actinospica robiniae]|uniref:GNAT family N-acetyltransferase n=1 Tax=Actinospica robiniae TaxID=304901 RepID=UPI00040DF090|nr:GNAT family N-acetyltransferase [Actinospica robiniae]